MTTDIAAKSEWLVKELNTKRAVLQNHHDNLRQLTSQKSENESVKLEFGKLESEASIWKLTGPLMVKQDRDEAKANVDKRLEFITSELQNAEDSIKKLEAEFEAQREELIAIQAQLQTSATAAK